MIGSRYVPGGGVEGEFNLKRKFMSTGINIYARMLLGLKSRDNSGSFRCYRVSKLALIDPARIRSRGYSFQEEILFWCRMAGCRMAETPILFENRRAGYSKITGREAVDALRIILELGIARALGRTRLDEDVYRLSASPDTEGGGRPGGSATSRSDHVVLADGHVHFLAGLGDPVAQALVLALELGRVHAEDLAEEGAVAGVGLVRELLQRLLDLVGQVEEELGLALDVGERPGQLGRDGAGFRGRDGGGEGWGSRSDSRSSTLELAWGSRFDPLIRPLHSSTRPRG